MDRKSTREDRSAPSSARETAAEVAISASLASARNDPVSTGSIGGWRKRRGRRKARWPSGVPRLSASSIREQGPHPAARHFTVWSSPSGLHHLDFTSRTSQGDSTVRAPRAVTPSYGSVSRSCGMGLIFFMRFSGCTAWKKDDRMRSLPWCRCSIPSARLAPSAPPGIPIHPAHARAAPASATPEAPAAPGGKDRNVRKEIRDGVRGTAPWYARARAGFHHPRRMSARSISPPERTQSEIPCGPTGCGLRVQLRETARNAGFAARSTADNRRVQPYPSSLIAFRPRPSRRPAATWPPAGGETSLAPGIQ